jgi:hypothetical protein
MSDPAHLEVRRLVTHALADLDLNFSLATKTDGAPLWELVFSDDHGAINLYLASDGEWLRLATAPLPCTPGQFEAALHLNARLPMARLALDDTGAWYVATEIPWAEASATRLRRAIGTVLAADREARAVLLASPK